MSWKRIDLGCVQGVHQISRQEVKESNNAVAHRTDAEATTENLGGYKQSRIFQVHVLDATIAPVLTATTDRKRRRGRAKRTPAGNLLKDGFELVLLINTSSFVLLVLEVPLPRVETL